jgi:hypothetical protein
MIELLAVPAWNAPTTTLAQWLEAFETQGLAVSVVRDSPQASWIEVNALRLRGYALMEGIKVEAVNFELTAPNPIPARQAVEAAATALAWEIDEDGDDDADDD